MEARINNAEAIAAFTFGGKSTFTLRSTKTGARYTYRINAGKPSPDGKVPYWTKVLTGQDNETAYSFIGTVWAEGDKASPLRRSAKVGISEQATSVVAFQWFLAQINAAREGRDNALDKVEFYHEGRCARCGRLLTVPESIESGLGPECATKANPFHRG